MANVQISTSQDYACFCDANSSAGLIPGPETVEYNDALYIYTEGDTPAAAVNAMIVAGRTPTDESYDRMVQDFESQKSLLDPVADAEDIAAIDELITGLRSVQDGSYIPPEDP